MLPTAPLPCGARSRRSMIERVCMSLAALLARTISELLRASASTEMPEAPDPPNCAAAGAPPAGTAVPPPPVPSARRCTSGARSSATAYFNVKISRSVLDGLSSAAMILARRERLSA
jgi:hypothetical protein